MALELEEIKLYLRIDAEDTEEDVLIQSLLDYSKEEIKDSTGAGYGEHGETETYKMLQKIIVVDRYENRGSTDAEWKKNNIFSAICTRLKARVEEYE